MSLIITSNIETQDGITLSSAYARLTVTDYAHGEQLGINLDYYPSDQAFLNGTTPARMANGISSFNMPYDRQAEGTDILMLAHEFAKAQLEDVDITSIIAELN